MNQTLLAALLGGAVGAVAGFAGSVIGALASLRASQIAARIPLAEKIHDLAARIVELSAALGTSSYSDKMKAFQLAWNDLIVHQKILAPDKRLQLLLELVRAAASDSTLGSTGFPDLAGRALNSATDIVATYSQHMFRWWARLASREIAHEFVVAVKPHLASQNLLNLCSKL